MLLSDLQEAEKQQLHHLSPDFMIRLKGEVIFNGKNIRSYTSAERACKIGFYSAEPFLFTEPLKKYPLWK